MNRALSIACGALASALAPATAGAAPPWSTPIDVGPHVARVATPSLEPAADGATLMTWGLRAGEPSTPQAPSTDRVTVATRAADGRLVTRSLREDVVAQAACGTGCVAVLRERTVTRRRAVLRVSIGSGAPALGRTRTLDRYLPHVFFETSGPSAPVLAALPTGAVAVAWVDGAGRRLRVAMRIPRGTFGSPRTVAEARGGRVWHPQIAFDAPDDVTVAYVRERVVAGRRRRTVEARRVLARGRLGRPQVVGPAPQSYTDLRIASAPGGRTVVAWGNVHGTVMGYEDRWVVRAASRARGTRRFATSQVLDPGSVKQAGAPGDVGVAVASDGTATVAWSAYTRPMSMPPPRTAVRVAVGRPGHRFGAPKVVGEGTLSDFAAAPDGAAIVTWTAWDGTVAGANVVAAVRAAGLATFGPPEQVASLRSSVYNAVDPSPAAAIDAGGAAMVAWAAEGTAGTPPMHVPMSAVVRLATRAPATPH